jgi:hypothetical protein
MSRQWIFAKHAQQLRTHGLAILPTDGKVPLIAGWRKWRDLPSAQTIERFVRQFPSANIAILPGLSRLFIADVDLAGQTAQTEDLFGRTPLHVATSRGRHLYYRYVEGCDVLPSNLAAIGLNVDLKAGNSIVIVPPSIHQSGAIYRHEGCDWNALRELPPPDLDRLRSALEKSRPVGNQIGADHRYTEGQRGLGLNRLLCRHAAYIDSFDELLDVARTINDDFLPPLDEWEVMKRVRQVWEDAQAGKLKPWVGGEAVARSRVSEIKQLCGLGRNGADAFTLLMFLRTQHAARCARGETFCIVSEAMQREQVIPGWSWKRYSAAVKLLLAAGQVVLVAKHRPSRGGGGRPALYSLISQSF